MKIFRFELAGQARYGIAEGDAVRLMRGSPFGAYELQDKTVSPAALRLLPACAPTKIIAVGLNYRTHAEELGMPLPEAPLLFMKPATAVIGPGDSILYPAMSARVDYEAELAVVIGTTCRMVSEADAAAHVLGYTCLNDVTARDLQQKDGQFTRSKSFDTFAPIGPAIETGLDPAALQVECFLNGERRQSGSTQDLIFPVPKLVSFISQIMTLHPGDIIATGTPSGIGPMQPGDEVEVRISGIGSLVNTIAQA